MDAEGMIATLGLRPHREGGWFIETWREPAGPGERAASTAIYYLLRAGEGSHWHRVDATEVWHYYAGGSLELRIAADERGPVTSHVLGPAIDAGERPQVIVPAGAWQSARPLAGWTLTGCTVAPGFLYEGSELAPPGWEPADTG